MIFTYTKFRCMKLTGDYLYRACILTIPSDKCRDNLIEFNCPLYKIPVTFEKIK